ncbi:MAG: CoA-binding protein [Flavobacteriales bacterium]|nr:CoA-binding protein [Flavobacteriales bacterium]
MKKKTLVVGASPNSARYGYKAVSRLRQYGHPVYAFGIRKGVIGDTEITDQWPNEAFDTVTLYLNPQIQKEYYDRILSLKPKRVIFNPGTENPEFYKKLEAAGIEVEVACTLVLLSVGSY